MTCLVDQPLPPTIRNHQQTTWTRFGNLNVKNNKDFFWLTDAVAGIPSYNLKSLSPIESQRITNCEKEVTTFCKQK